MKRSISPLLNRRTGFDWRPWHAPPHLYLRPKEEGDPQRVHDFPRVGALEFITSCGRPLLTSFQANGKLIADGKFEPAGFAAPLGHKDIRLTLAAAETLRVPLPLASLLRDRFLTLLANGGDMLDWWAIAGLAARDAGLSAR
jgi:NAD-binding of NADP-dependent 3-hydroxyisobutyrate dehydrogenase